MLSVQVAPLCAGPSPGLSGQQRFPPVKIWVRHLCLVSGSCWSLFYQHLAEISLVNKVFCLWGLCAFTETAQDMSSSIDRQGALHTLFFALFLGGSEGCNTHDEWMCFILCSILNESLKAYISPYLSITSNGQSVVVYLPRGLGKFARVCRTRSQQ